MMSTHMSKNDTSNIRGQISMLEVMCQINNNSHKFVSYINPGYFYCIVGKLEMSR